MLIFTGSHFVEQAFDSRTAAGAFVGWMLSHKTAQDIYDWANFVGVCNLLDPEEMHCTMMYAPDARLESDAFGERPLPMPVEVGRHNLPQTRVLGKPGSAGALVTTYDSEQLHARHRYWRDERNLVHSFPTFLPHVTLSYDAASQRPDVMQIMHRCPCMLPVTFDRERVALANPPA